MILFKCQREPVHFHKEQNEQPPPSSGSSLHLKSNAWPWLRAWDLTSAPLSYISAISFLCTSYTGLCWLPVLPASWAGPILWTEHVSAWMAPSHLRYKPLRVSLQRCLLWPLSPLLQHMTLCIFYMACTPLESLLLLDLRACLHWSVFFWKTWSSTTTFWQNPWWLAQWPCSAPCIASIQSTLAEWTERETKTQLPTIHALDGQGLRTIQKFIMTNQGSCANYIHLDPMPGIWLIRSEGREA